ncbi:hypothetical protein PPYR_02098 [Photinus pyralis]|uniref:PiggyBac transposable element-derived protein domain-containing protein n=1 Tax=Photinus pyralis TaxID=7054 RepID=A0A5N4B6E2_PHOPY|nr:hypothetical protein PPYR_02098 [Photinus pyralis]
MDYYNTRALTLAEIEDIINDPNFMEDVESADIVVLPPETDYLTDEDEADDDILGIAEVNDVPGELELQYTTSQSERVEVNDSNNTEIPASHPKCTSTKSNKRKRILTDVSPTWRKVHPSYTKLPTEGKGATVRFENMTTKLIDKTPCELFETMFTDDVIDYITKETVRYASAVKNDTKFTLSSEDIKAFLGVLLFSGYHKLPSERHYWSEQEDLGVNIVKNCMSRNKYLKIKSYIHFNDNDQANVNKSDKGFKVRPLIIQMNEKFQQWGIFVKELSIDEMIVKYFGKRGLKQFIRGKPIRFGYKLWALCSSNGYCFQFDLYCGAETSTNVARNGDLALGSRVVVNLLDCVEDASSHCVYFDNLFTSRDLLLYLQQKGFRATGTLRENRLAKCPIKDSKSLGKESRGVFDYRFDSSGEILFLKWNDNKCVTIATNHETIEPLHQAARWDRKNKEKKQIPQPRVLKQYNIHMGGVDQHDWNVGKYAVQIRAKKWYWALFTRMIDMAVVNSWIIYKMINKSSMPLLTFRRAIAVTYLKLGVKPALGRPIMSSASKIFDDVRYDSKSHFMGTRDKQRRCQGDNCKSKPLTFCVKCQVTLCKQCFVPYHSK